MGKKYSINSAGKIVAERDIYSLGGLLLKGTVGGSIKDETQLSQEGECWINSGDISNRPDIVIKDNAFIGGFEPGINPVHTDGITEFSGNTKIPGTISIRCFKTDTKNNIFIKDSFIGISMDVICGPATNTKAFPFEQGAYNKDVPKGTLFTSGTMKYDDPSICRNTATLRIGPDTYLYTPAGYNARVFWAYFDYAKNGLAYAGETLPVTKNLIKLEHPVYNVCMVQFARQSGITPTQLEESGAKILGHISGSVLMDIRPESASGTYVMDGSKFIMPTDNFGLNVTQLRFLAGGMYNTNMYTKTDRQDYKPYGTFRNVELLEYLQYFADIHRGNVNRDHYIVASDSPLVRISEGFVSGPLVNAGGVTLRRCIVPKASFSINKVLGNTYEDIDFSYAQEHIGKTHAGRTLRSSHVQGHYDLFGSGDELTGVISRPENLDTTARVQEDRVYTPLDGDLIESGTYEFLPGQFFEDCKIGAGDRVRMRTPLSTRGAVIPSIPSGYRIRYAFYLDEYFIMSHSEEEPTSLNIDYPYVLLAFRKEDSSELLSVSEFVSKGLFMQNSDYTRYPIISGSGYVGAGVIVRGDVQVIGQPYVNRLLDMNEWERGSASPQVGDGWENHFILPGQFNRLRTKHLIPVEPGGTISREAGGKMYIWYFDQDGGYTGTNSGWVTSVVIPANAFYIGAIIDVNGDGFISEFDVSLANIKYVNAFKKSRYITNELDRKDPSDTLLTPDYWEQGSMASGDANAGKTYEELKTAYTKAIRLKRPINVYMPGQTTGEGAGFKVSRQVFDVLTKLYAPVSDAVYAKTALITIVTVKSDASEVLPNEAPNSRVYVEFTPSPRIVVPYGSATLIVTGMRIRMYDNSVLSRNLSQEGDIVLQGNAVMGYDFDSGACMCSNGHSDAIIKLP